MSYLIYNVDSLHVIDTFPTERGAKISWARKHKRDPKLSVANADTFRNEIDHDVQVPSLLGGGKPVTIRKSQVGTCCDPSTERYWSM